MRSRLRRLSAATLVAGLLAAGCSRDGSSTTGGEGPAATGPGSTASATAPPEGARPQDSVAEAVEVLLDAEARRDRATSFTVLGPPLRAEYPTVSVWERRRNELGVPTGFDVEPGPADDRATARVTYEASLDPFRGLVPAAEQQTWTGVAVDGGWLLAAEPEVEPSLPPDEQAVAAATEWTAAVQRCDRPAAEALQGVAILFGDGRAAEGLCGATGPVAAGVVEGLETGPGAMDIVAQYGTEALRWARVVRMTSPKSFAVVLAPLADRWVVLGVGPP